MQTLYALALPNGFYLSNDSVKFNVLIAAEPAGIAFAWVTPFPVLADKFSRQIPGSFLCRLMALPLTPDELKTALLPPG